MVSTASARRMEGGVHLLVLLLELLGSEVLADWAISAMGAGAKTSHRDAIVGESSVCTQINRMVNE